MSNNGNAQGNSFANKKSEFESPYRHYKLDTSLRMSCSQEPPSGIADGKKPNGNSGNNKVTLFARSSTVSASFGYNLYNMPIIKNLTLQDYNLLNVRNTKERPYFFGLGMPSRFNCNHGFDKKKKDNAQNNEDD